MDNRRAFPVIRQTVLDTTDPRRLAEFYRLLFGLRYRPGDEPPGPGQPDPKGQDWLVLKSPAGGAALAFQKVGELPGATWPDGPVPQQLHPDTTVPTAADLEVSMSGRSRSAPGCWMTARMTAGAAAGLRGPRGASVLHLCRLTPS
jgi:Glyoxalase-like domain